MTDLGRIDIYVVSSQLRVPAGKTPDLMDLCLVAGLDPVSMRLVIAATTTDLLGAYPEDVAQSCPVLAWRPLFGQEENVPVLGPPLGRIAARPDPAVVRNLRQQLGVALHLAPPPDKAFDPLP